MLPNNVTFENASLANVEALSPGLRATHSVCSLIIALSGIVGNSITIHKMVHKTHPQQSCYLYLLNLSVNNLISSGVILPLIGINSFFNGWIYGSTFCKVFAYLMYMNLCAEVNALILLTLNRFLKIVYPLIYPVVYGSRCNNAAVITSSWSLYSLLLVLPISGKWGQFGYDPAKNYCSLIRNDNYILFLSGLLLVTSAPVMFISYISILRTYIQSKRKIADIKKRNNSDTKEQTTTFTQKELRLLRTILTVLACFVLTYMPYLILAIVDPRMAILGRGIHTACTYFSWSHVALNPLIYTLRHSRKKT